MSSCSRSAAAEAETVASEGGMVTVAEVTVAEAMEKGVGVKVVVTVAIAEEMAAMVAVAYWM